MTVLARRLVFILCFAGLCFAQSKPLHVRNFGEVNDHLYRGAVPSNIALEELAAMHVSTVIDLREPGEGTDIEKGQVEALGMKYIGVPLRPFSAPSQEQMNKILSLLLQHDSERVFVHCRRGKDRTGTVVACYRMQHDGWDNQQALSEAHKYGMSFTERGMRSFILHFTPAAPGALAQASH